MNVDFTRLPARQAYHWMTAMIVPRPIAWVSSLSPAGIVNLAPFSFFNGITSRPPMLMFVPVTKSDGTPKDTLRNIEATKEFVVNLVSAQQAEAMNATSAELPPDESEFDHFSIDAVASDRVAPPRVAGAPIAMECKLEQITRIGDAGARSIEAIRTDAVIYDLPPGQYRSAKLPGTIVYGPGQARPHRPDGRRGLLHHARSVHHLATGVGRHYQTAQTQQHAVLTQSPQKEIQGRKERHRADRQSHGLGAACTFAAFATLV